MSTSPRGAFANVLCTCGPGFEIRAMDMAGSLWSQCHLRKVDLLDSEAPQTALALEESCKSIARDRLGPCP